MQESTQSKHKKTKQLNKISKIIFTPNLMGILVLIIIVLSFIGAAARKESALFLTGVVFLAAWSYSLVMIFITAFFSYTYKRSKRAFINVSPSEIFAGEQTEAFYSEITNNTNDTNKEIKEILSLPGIIVRCRLNLETKDGRKISCDFSLMKKLKKINKNPFLFTVPKRGAYFYYKNELAIFDALGFFRFAFRLQTNANNCLLAFPHAATESLKAQGYEGDSNELNELTLKRNDNLINNRPYIAGDDPRRINWKLYGHAGGLFVREGERERQPNSNIIIMVDSSFDPALYTQKKARAAVDVLCEHALSAAITCKDTNMNLCVSYLGSIPNEFDIKNSHSLHEIFSRPYAMPISSSLKFQPVNENFSILIFALVRTQNETAATAIDDFLKTTNTAKNNSKIGKRDITIIFICDGSENLIKEAFTCTSLYNKSAGIKAYFFSTGSNDEKH